MPGHYIPPPFNVFSVGMTHSAELKMITVRTDRGITNSPHAKNSGPGGFGEFTFAEKPVFFHQDLRCI